jgi:hypothetical protein
VNCGTCGRELLASETRCPACGAAAPPGGASSGPAAGAARGSATYRFERSRWSSTDVVSGVATIAVLVALFLPWFGVSLGVVGLTVSGLTAHGYLYLVLVLGLVELCYLVALAGLPEIRTRLPLPHEAFLSTLNAVDLVIVLIAFANKGPSGIGWRYGAFVALVAALVAALPKVAISLSGRLRRN